MYPEFVYRYRPLGQSAQRDDEEIAALEKSYLWFSKFDQLNDPAELADANIEPIPEGLEASLDRLSDSLSEIARVQHRKAQHRSANLIPKDSSSVCCFSETGNQQAMWAYYANNYQGMCIKYDLKKLISLSQVCWGDRFFKVDYKDERFLPASQYLHPNESELAPSSILTKHTDWAHEKEWRLFNRSTHGIFYHTSNAIIEVTLGPRVAPINYNRLIDCCRTAGIKLTELKFDNYNLVLREILSPPPRKDNPRCFLSDLAKDSRSWLLKEGIDERSLDAAVDIARQYPNASQVSYLFLSDDQNHLNVHVFFKFPNGKDLFKTLAFKIQNKKVSPVFEYVI